MTIEEARAVLERRLPEIERRVAWVRERESNGTGYGQQFTERLMRRVTAQLAELRVMLELPPAAPADFSNTRDLV